MCWPILPRFKRLPYLHLRQPRRRLEVEDHAVGLIQESLACTPCIVLPAAGPRAGRWRTAYRSNRGRRECKAGQGTVRCDTLKRKEEGARVASKGQVSVLCGPQSPVPEKPLFVLPRVRVRRFVDCRVPAFTAGYSTGIVERAHSSESFCHEMRLPVNWKGCFAR